MITRQYRYAVGAHVSVRQSDDPDEPFTLWIVTAHDPSDRPGGPWYRLRDAHTAETTTDAPETDLHPVAVATRTDLGW